MNLAKSAIGMTPIMNSRQKKKHSKWRDIFAQWVIVDAGGASDVGQQHRKGADREGVAEDEEAEEDDRPGHGAL